MNNDDDRIREYPSYNENRWFSLAVAGSLITLVGAFFAAAWVFSETDPEIRARAAAALTPFGTIMIAAVTFCTVAWRGLVGSRQADQQRRQNEATDDANFAKLLQEGAKLLADEKAPNQLAGIASLNVLLTEPKGRFANEAIDVLAEAFKSLYREVTDHLSLQDVVNQSLHSSLVTLLSRESRIGRFSSVDLSIHSNATGGVDLFWPRIAGMRFLSITGGAIAQPGEMLEGLNKRVFYTGVRFVGSKRKIGFDYVACTFESCEILELQTVDFDAGYHKFFKCDFSGCRYDSHGTFVVDNMTYNDCWFDIENAPISSDGDLTLHLQPRIRIDGAWKTLNQVSRENDPLTDEQRDLILKYDR